MAGRHDFGHGVVIHGRVALGTGIVEALLGMVVVVLGALIRRVEHEGCPEWKPWEIPVAAGDLLV